MPNCRVLIVDDSTVYRSQIRAALEGVPGIEVVGFASNGRLACEVLKGKQVDLITLDMEMPEMDGLATLAELKRLGIGAKVIVFSSQTKSGAENTMAALRLGAVDFIAKPSLDPKAGSPAEMIRALLAPKIQQFGAAFAGLAPPLAAKAAPALATAGDGYAKINWRTFSPAIVTIASSTGGPAALEALFAMVRGPLACPILIAQHMPPVFTATLAERLGRASGLEIAEAKPGEALVAGRVYMAPGDWHLKIGAGGKNALLDQGPARGSVRPAADHLFETAAAAYGNRTLGIVLTGMGADGRDGSLAIKRAGGAVLIQSRETCVVFGMPGAVAEARAFDEELNLAAIAARLNELRLCRLAEAA
ncbi:MAG: chemotaxis-specific protein-glutamate methyltransferase CheB [Proteobacteria bacterium]|nr:MAG: chemotaxis-specific protein-glutamate methyltransferase CheB [Pseudomonadota bacterium]